jgi:hypothetical protein
MSHFLARSLILSCGLVLSHAFPQEVTADSPRKPKVLWTVETKSDSKGSAAVADIDGDGMTYSQSLYHSR